MVRLLVSLHEGKLKKIDGIAKKAKKSRAQVLRDAVDLYLKKHADSTDGWKELVGRTAGMWRQKRRA